MKQNSISFTATTRCLSKLTLYLNNFTINKLVV